MEHLKIRLGSGLANIRLGWKGLPGTMEQQTLKTVKNYLNNNIYSYLGTSGGQSSNLHLNVVHFFYTSVN